MGRCHERPVSCDGDALPCFIPTGGKNHGVYIMPTGILLCRRTFLGYRDVAGSILQTQEPTVIDSVYYFWLSMLAIMVCYPP